MWSLFRTEWQKINANRWQVGLMVWVFPLGALGANVVIFVLSLLTRQFSSNLGAINLKWTESMLAAWDVPFNILVRFLLICFVVLLFAQERKYFGENPEIDYLTVLKVWMMKCFTIVVYLTVIFILTTMLWGLGQGILVKMAGGDYGPPLSRAALLPFLRVYAKYTLLAVSTIMLVVGYAGMAFLITRRRWLNLLAATFIGLIEPFWLFGLIILWLPRNLHWVTYLIRVTPYYHIINAQNFLADNVTPFALSFGDSFRRSFALLTLGGIILLALTVIGQLIGYIRFVRSQSVSYS